MVVIDDAFTQVEISTSIQLNLDKFFIIIPRNFIVWDLFNYIYFEMQWGHR